MNIFVGNLSRDVTEDELFKLFGQFGQVKEVKIIRNPSTNESKGYGFVEMSDLSEAHNAIDSLNTKGLKGKRMTVNEGRSQKFERRKGKGSLSSSENNSNQKN